MGLHQRFPWLLPLVSFIGGWIGFAMVKRGEGFARAIALLALLGWFWLLVEPWIRQRLERRRPKMGNFVVNFVSQSLQQELLFFSLPFLIGATQRDLGQIAFTAVVALAALVSTADPVYERVVARRAVRRLLFHAYCSWLSALIVLPMVLRLPVEKALPLSVIAVTAWLLLTLPMSVRSLKHLVTRAIWVAGVVVLPVALWELRAQVPPAGLAVTSARITQTIDDMNPGPAVHEIKRADLARGVVAFAAIRAPAGLSQDIIFEWHHNGEHRARFGHDPWRQRRWVPYLLTQDDVPGRCRGPMDRGRADAAGAVTAPAPIQRRRLTCGVGQSPLPLFAGGAYHAPNPSK